MIKISHFGIKSHRFVLKNQHQRYSMTVESIISMGVHCVWKVQSEYVSDQETYVLNSIFAYLGIKSHMNKISHLRRTRIIQSHIWENIE